MESVNNFGRLNTGCGVRHFQVLLLFLGMMFIELTKVNMNIAIVAMTDTSQNGTFDWSHQTQSVILSSFKWGYLLSKIPGGVLSSRFGGKIVLTVCGTINCAVCLVLPTAAYYGGWQAVCACRLLQGLGMGVQRPCVHTLAGKWVPAQERASLSTAMSSGGNLGTAVEYVLAGIIANSWGWQTIFYVNSGILAVWTFAYILLGSSSPQNSRHISFEELTFIQSSLKQTSELRVKTPWRAMLSSVPFLALILTDIGVGWDHWTILTEMPTYVHKVLGVNIKANGLMSALPYFAAFATCFIFGPLSDYVIRKGWVTVITCRKINNSIASFGQAVVMIVLSYVAYDVTTAIVLLTICVGLSSGFYAGFNLVILDMAPNHAGTMLGVVGFVSNVFSTFAPLAAGWLIHDDTSLSEWRKVFFLSAGLFCCSNIFFLMFGTSELQKWNDYT